MGASVGFCPQVLLTHACFVPVLPWIDATQIPKDQTVQWHTHRVRLQ